VVSETGSEACVSGGDGGELPDGKSLSTLTRSAICGCAKVGLTLGGTQRLTMDERGGVGTDENLPRRRQRRVDGCCESAGASLYTSALRR
jgi:hypothetical protein